MYKQSAPSKQNKKTGAVEKDTRRNSISCRKFKFEHPCESGGDNDQI